MSKRKRARCAACSILNAPESLINDSGYCKECVSLGYQFKDIAVRFIENRLSKREYTALQSLCLFGDVSRAAGHTGVTTHALYNSLASAEDRLDIKLWNRRKGTAKDITYDLLKAVKMYSQKQTPLHQAKEMFGEFYSVSDMSGFLAIHPESVRRLARDRKIPAVKIFNKWLVPKSAFDPTRVTYPHQSAA